MRPFSNLFRDKHQQKQSQLEKELAVAKAKANASHHREVVNSSLKVLRNSDCPKEKRKHVQIVKERLSSINKMTKEHPFITVSTQAMAQVEKEIHRVEAELQNFVDNGDTHQLNPAEMIQQIKLHKSQENYNEAAKLLMHCISSLEEACAPGMGISPWYYEQLAEIFRHNKEYAKEVSVIERYLRRDRSPGQGRSKLYKRLDEARRLQGR